MTLRIAVAGMAAAFALAAAVPVLAQQSAPSPFVPLEDHPSCTVAELTAATDAYVAAQRKGDISGLAFADKAHFLQNMDTVERDKGIWNTALKVDRATSFHDAQRCKTFTEVIVADPAHPYVIGTRLYLHNGHILRMESLVSQKGDWLFNANAYLKYSGAVDWGVAPPATRTSAADMIRGANAYFDAFSDKFTDIPWGTPCARLEGGAYTDRDHDPKASCNIGIPPGVLYIVNRDYLIDEEHGVINVWARFGDSRSGAPDSHVFQFVNGKIRQIHTISVTPGPQADDNGAIVRN